MDENTEKSSGTGDAKSSDKPDERGTGENCNGETSRPAKSKLKKLIDEAKKAIKTLAGTPRVIKLVWRTHPLYAFMTVCFSLAMAIAPIANLWIGKLIVDALTDSGAKIGLANLSLSTIISIFSSSKLMPLLLLMASIELTLAILKPSLRYVSDQLGDLLSRDINELILRKANSLVDIAFFESSEFYDNLQRAQNEAGYRPLHMFQGLLQVAQCSVTFLIMSMSFLIFQPVITLLVLLFSLPNFIFQFNHQQESFAINQWKTPEVRKMHYYSSILADKQHASEIRMFNLADFFLSKYLQKFEEFRVSHKKLRLRHLQQNMLFGFFGSLADISAYAYLALRTITGSISIGTFYFYSNALSQVQTQLWNLIWSVSSLYEDNLFLNNLFQFLDMKPTMVPPDPTWALQAPRPIGEGIEFRNVSFRYAGSDRDVLSGLNFTLSPNQAVALVGENGAGKTTIVKLLGRLYDPSEGEILVDGVNLKDIDLDSWRRQMAVIFQDFASYHLSAGENIGIGEVNFINDEIRIKSAADRGGATSVIEKLPKKFDTLLVKCYGENDDSSDLSGGEWQKMALARAFMRAPQAEINGYDSGVEKHLRDGIAQVLVLDEPTASLDVQSEHDIYMRFQELTKGKTTVLISHRFSTVRMADQILLLEQGKIAEQGSHEELMTLDGAYARLYKLQADKYI